jgi:hypothetical protein
MKLHLVAGLVLLLTTFVQTRGAEYKGRDVDGESFDCSAYSYSTHKYYNVTVEFDGDEATLTFSQGGKLVLTLDDEDIDDPSAISAYDFRHRTYWDLEVDDLED